jgi:hypothetical protein
VAYTKAVDIAILQYQKGATGFNTYAVIVLDQVAQQTLAAQARGQIAQGLISVYLALGGGWEIACDNAAAAAPAAPAGTPTTTPPRAPGTLTVPEPIPVPVPPSH